MTKEEQLNKLEKHFMGCVRYWERELNTSSDLSKEPYKMALDEIPDGEPDKMESRAEKFDMPVLSEFKKYRLMDTYGRDWMLHWNDHSSWIKYDDSLGHYPSSRRTK